MAKLDYKLEISGTIEVLTGLHIGGSDVDLTIGGIDSEVAKIKRTGQPYIPGSSLSGKLRSLIAKAQGYKYLNFTAARDAGEIPIRSWDEGYLALLFSGKWFNVNIELKKDKFNKTITYKYGKDKTPAEDYDNISNNNIDDTETSFAPHTRLLVRDCYLKKTNVSLDDILEDKAENVIDRNTGEANPRHIERVVTGTKFELKMILDIYQYDNVMKLLETLNLGINLLNNDYLGGMGSRGSGEVKIVINTIKKLEFVNGVINESIYPDYTFN